MPENCVCNFALQPSQVVFRDMLNRLANGRENEDGADQGFLTGYFDDMLGKPMFRPKLNGSRQNGFFRLPLGYQMDASYYCKQHNNPMDTR